MLNYSYTFNRDNNVIHKEIEEWYINSKKDIQMLDNAY